MNGKDKQTISISYNIFYLSLLLRINILWYKRDREPHHYQHGGGSYPVMETLVVPRRGNDSSTHHWLIL